MTDKQVKKGLEYCAVEVKCNACPYITDRNCREQMNTDALALINRLEEENADKERYTIELYNRAREAERELNKWKQAFVEFDKFGDMTTPIGLFPINETGMRKLVDYCNTKLTEINRLEAEKEEVCKETAKDIINDLFNACDSSPYDCVEPSYIVYLAKKYGVEVE